MTIEEKIAEIIEESQDIKLEEDNVNEEVEELDEGTVDPADAHRILTQTGGVDTDHYSLSDDDVIKRVKLAKEHGYVARGDSPTGRSQNYRTTLHLQRQAAKYKQNEDLQISMKEDIAALTSGEELSEEFKEKAATIFEAAVTNRVKQEVSKLDEAYEVRLAEEVEQVKEGLIEKVDGYLGYIVEQWIEHNEIALESGMKSEILEGFVSGLKSLFEEHYIDVPDEKFDIVGSLAEEVEDLKSKLDEQFKSNVELNQTLIGYQVKQVASELSEDLSHTDKEKFYALIEELEVDGIESFKKKAQTIRESYFTNKVGSRSTIGSIITDESVVLSEDRNIPAHMKGYLSILDNLK